MCCSLLAFLPHILDSGAAGRQRHLRMLADLAAKYGERPFGFLWAQGAAQPALEKSLEVGGCAARRLHDIHQCHLHADCKRDVQGTALHPLQSAWYVRLPQSARSWKPSSSFVLHVACRGFVMSFARVSTAATC